MKTAQKFSLFIIFVLSLPCLQAAELLSLQEATKLSLEKNFDIRVSALTSTEKEGGLTKAHGDFDLNLSASYTLNDTRTPSSSNLDGVDASSFLFTRTRTASVTLKKKFGLGTEVQLPYSYPQTGSNSTFQRIPLTYSPSFTLKASQPLTQLFSPGYFNKKINEASLDVAIASSKHKDKIESTLFKTIELFLDTLKEQETSRIKETAYVISKETLEFVKEKERVGRASLLDRLEAESSIQKTYEAWLTLKTNFQNKKEELAIHVFAEAAHPFELDDPLKTIAPPPPVPPLTELINTALQKRPELQTNLESVAKAEVTQSAASIDRFPKLNVKGDLTYSSLNKDFSSSHQELAQRKFKSWSAEVSLEHPLFMYASRGAYQIADLKLKQEELKKLQTERNITLEIRKNTRQLQSHWQRIQAFEKVIESENEKFKGEEARFKAGKISVYEFNLSVNSKNSAELDLIKAKIDFQKTFYKLAESKGELLETLGLK